MMQFRPAISMMEDAEKKGLITPGKVSVLLTSLMNRIT
jgi:cysteine synthase